MKETKKCSISGLSFTMEEDAYRTLKEYLDSLKKTYSDNPDGSEIIADIEARIAELILSTQDSDRIVERPLIMNIIAQLGTAEDISEESAADEPTRTPQGEPRIPRRLYRDMENARLGGVCAGIAKYFNIEIPWVRLACCAPLLLIILGHGWVERMGINLFGVAVLSYLIMWIAVPAARTARQKLEANGEKITVQSIRDASAASGNSSDVDSVARPVVAETVTVFGRIVILLLKLVAGVVVFGLILAALALFMGLCVLLFAGSDIFGNMGGATGEWLLAVDNGTFIAVLAVCVVLLPILMLLYVLLSLILGTKPGRWVLLTLFLLWLLTIIGLPVTAVKSKLHRFRANYSYSNSGYADEHERLQDSIDEAAARFVLPESDSIPTIRCESADGLPSIDLD